MRSLRVTLVTLAGHRGRRWSSQSSSITEAEKQPAPFPPKPATPAMATRIGMAWAEGCWEFSQLHCLKIQLALASGKEHTLKEKKSCDQLHFYIGEGHYNYHILNWNLIQLNALNHLHLWIVLAMRE